MYFFNEAKIKAFETGRYICEKCGSVMKFENEWEETLICEKCGHEVELEKYGFTDEEYEDLYPTLEEVLELEEGSNDD